jgi:hypothetical protein
MRILEPHDIALVRYPFEARVSEHTAMSNRAKDWFAQAGCDLELAQEAWGHVVARLLAELPIPAAADLVDKAKVLDNFYVATRYANGHPAGAPFEHYGKLQSDQAIQCGGEIVEFARIEMAAAERR